MGDIAQLDLVLGEDLGILAETQAIEPLLECADQDIPVTRPKKNCAGRLGPMSNCGADHERKVEYFPL